MVKVDFISTLDSTNFQRILLHYSWILLASILFWSAIRQRSLRVRSEEYTGWEATFSNGVVSSWFNSSKLQQGYVIIAVDSLILLYGMWPRNITRSASQSTDAITLPANCCIFPRFRFGSSRAIDWLSIGLWSVVMKPCFIYCYQIDGKHYCYYGWMFTHTARSFDIFKVSTISITFKLL